MSIKVSLSESHVRHGIRVTSSTQRETAIHDLSCFHVGWPAVIFCSKIMMLAAMILALRVRLLVIHELFVV